MRELEARKHTVAPRARRAAAASATAHTSAVRHTRTIGRVWMKLFSVGR